MHEFSEINQTGIIIINFFKELLRDGLGRINLFKLRLKREEVFENFRMTFDHLLW